jgi:hypothetical protein
MALNLKANVEQISPSILPNGSGYLAMTKLGQLYTADWKYKLAAAGLVYTAHIGTLTTGADVGLITGGGAGTTVDSDQPELIVGVDTGYIIPMEIIVSCNLDMDANAEYGEILFFADRTQAPPTTATGTPGIVTPNNQLDGGATFGGRCFGGITTDITDPVMSELINFVYTVGSDNGTAGNLVSNTLRMEWKADIPKILAGPCSLVACFGGTAAVTGMISITFASVPASYFPLVA